jgi:hypothetical protein
MEETRDAVRSLCRATRDAVDAKRTGIIVPLAGIRRGDHAECAEICRQVKRLLERGKNVRRIVLDNETDSHKCNGLRDDILVAMTRMLELNPRLGLSVVSLVLMGLEKQRGGLIELTDAALGALLHALPVLEELHLDENNCDSITGECLGELAARRGQPLDRLVLTGNCDGKNHCVFYGVPPGSVMKVTSQWSAIYGYYMREFFGRAVNGRPVIVEVLNTQIDHTGLQLRIESEYRAFLRSRFAFMH